MSRGVEEGVGEREGGGNMEDLPRFRQTNRRNMSDARMPLASTSLAACLVASIGGVVPDVNSRTILLVLLNFVVSVN